MTGTQLAALIRFKTGTNSTTFTDAEMLPLVNIFKNEIASKIVEKNSGYFLVSYPFNLVADTRQYSFPADVLNRMKKLEIKFSASDSRKPSRYIKDYLDSETESEIVSNFGNAEGEFAHTIRNHGVFILSGTIISVTLGGNLLYYVYPADLTVLSVSTDLSIDASVSSFGLPKAFHELLARRVSIEWKGSQPTPIALNRYELNYDNDLKTALDALSTTDESGDVIGDELPLIDTGNNGHNY